MINITSYPPAVVPILIFCARIVDVSCGTLKIILVGRGKRKVASILAFFEVLIWLLAISQIVQNLTSVPNYLAYAGGFATGTYVGMTIERKLSMGTLLVRLILTQDAADMMMYLIANDFRVTRVEGHGALGPVEMLYTVVPRARLGEVVGVIRARHPDAFYTIEDLRHVSDKTLISAPTFPKSILDPLNWIGKAK